MSLAATRQSGQRNTARSLLGEHHPLAQIVSVVETVQMQAATVALVVGVAVALTLMHVAFALILFSVSLVVEGALLVVLSFALQVRTERVWDVIIDGGAMLDVPAVTRQRERLASRKRRDELARSLARVLDSSERWHEITVTSRPPEGVRLLAEFAPEVREIIDRVRSHGSGVKGIAQLARFLAGGSSSRLCSLDNEAVRSELARIACLLAAPDPSSYHD